MNISKLSISIPILASSFCCRATPFCGVVVVNKKKFVYLW